MTFSREQWVAQRKATALRLAGGECGGVYADGVIILCAVISAIAAEAWPGRNIDRKRFVEALKEFCDPTLTPLQISIPLLVGYLRNRGRTIESEVLRKKYLDFGRSRVIGGKDVDQAEDQVLRDCPSLTNVDVRPCAYACVLYEDVRNSYMHEYRSGPRVDPWPLSRYADAVVSYGNWVDDPDRHIHFPIEWLGNVADSVAAGADRVADRFPLLQPKWWLDG